MSILGWVNICEYAKHANRSSPLTPQPRASISTLWCGLPLTTRRSGLHGWQDAFCLSRQPSAPSTDPRHPPLLLGSVRLSPGWVGKCWRQLTLGRPAPTGEMVVPLVTFSFFPRVLSSVSPHVQRQILGLGGELSQLRLWGNREEARVVMSNRTAGWVPWGTGLSGIKWRIVMGSPAPRSRPS